MIQILGWACTVAILVGFALNARKQYVLALYIWIIGDIGWIWYDYLISNWSHATLSSALILINIYGRYNLKAKVLKKKDIQKIPNDYFI